MMKVLKEPLLHFMLISLALFALYAAVSSGNVEPSSERITVDRETLINFMQYRNRSFEREKFEVLLDEMDADELDRVIERFVVEEALFREAKSMRLDENDYVTRMRLVQQLEYLTRAGVSKDYEPSSEELKAYYREHKDAYFIEPTVTFSHIFVSRADRSAEAVEEKLVELAGRLETGNVGFTDASSYGDRFLYHVNYVEKGFGYLASHFGQDMATSLISLQASADAWQGPFESPHGFHYVFMLRRTDGFQPALADILNKVSEDVYQDEMARRNQEALDAIAERYAVVKKPLTTEQSSKVE